MRASSASSESERAVLAAVALSGTLLPLNSTMIAVAPLGGNLADRRGYRAPAVFGLSLLVLATAALAAMGAAPTAFGLAAALLLAGSGSDSRARRSRRPRWRPSSSATPASPQGCTRPAATPAAS